MDPKRPMAAALALAMPLSLLASLAIADPSSQPSALDVAPVQHLPANPAAPKEKAGHDEEKPELLTIDGGIDFTTAYYFRGYKIENSGLIMQPYGTLHLNAIHNDEFSLSPYINTWNSIHSESRDADDWKYWAETDVIAGAELSHGNWTLNLSYNLYLFPNGNIRQTEEIGAILSYDDTELTQSIWKDAPIAFNPHVAWYHEIHDLNGSEDTYLEAGIEPSYQPENSKWSFAVPMVLGMSTDSFYTDGDGHNSFFGYGSIGLKTSYQLSEHWSINAAVTYQRLWSASVVAENDGGHDVVLGTLGLGFSYCLPTLCV
jgi:hypothetical protein